MLRSMAALAFVALLLALAGCTGMYLGVQGERPTSSGSLGDDVTARVDIHTITPETVYQQRQELEAAAQLDQARRNAAVPNSNGSYQYLVAPGDILNVIVWNHPELNNPAGQITSEIAGRVVADDGYFFYPYAGRVKAAGRRTTDIRNELTQKLTQYLTEPQVDVSVVQYRGRKVFAVGQFNKPGPVALTDVPLRVTDVVTRAEGLNENADEREAVLTRNGVRYAINLYALYQKGDMSQNLVLQDGDILNVAEKRYNKVFVLGEVVKPQSVLLPYGAYTLAEALGDAGGLNPTTSNGSQVYVLRAVPGAKPQVWHLNANSPDALVLADGFRLQARDVVFVDAAAVTRWSRVINQLLPSVGGLTNLDNLAR
ncbi:polysaccharide biosynthesis/export family protein [Pusillimonas minor]|uniref:Polysaccharide biosynthesis/export family protein n=1 Tax=Pusillimonas minor TaxID=2697024 RepID=A0A842HNN5_9BURK|nr:polysaccharide biosynthesis/export family protein [Pusillimonas minor]MBC2769836.1 polysaccharide biosynthesis/export family protein [Pusillimonas minor]